MYQCGSRVGGASSALILSDSLKKVLTRCGAVNVKHIFFTFCYLSVVNNHLIIFFGCYIEHAFGLQIIKGLILIANEPSKKKGFTENSFA